MTDINSELPFTDKVLYNAYILLAKDSDGNKYNFIDLKDMVAYIQSSIELVSHPFDNMLALYDIISLNKSHIELPDENMISFIDKVMYKSYLMMDKDSEGNKFNHVEFKDLIDHIKTRYEIVQVPSENIINFFDYILSSSTNIDLNPQNNTGPLFKDRLAKVYYEEHKPFIDKEFSFFDKVFTTIILKLTKVYDKETGNTLSLNDKFNEICVEYSLTPRASFNSLSFNDSIQHNSFVDINENKSDSMFKDRVVMRYYS
jgi:co-chaperonin GroES (HSP10)